MSADQSTGRQQGIVADWNDERGFGFIAPSAGGPRVFAHVSAFPRGPRPAVGHEVTYAEVPGERNRTRAADVRYVGSGPVQAGRASKALLALAGALLFFALLALLLELNEVPVVVVAAYGVLSVVAFVMYGVDKSAARHGRWRTAEPTLHTIALVGGWPGALVARHVFRHKTSKQPFRTVYWVTVVLNCLALAWLVYNPPLALP